MMQIEFEKEHDSIKFFDSISLGKFSIITGRNGSGKTHFLKGIHEGKFKVTIDGQTLSRIGYFDYNEFKQNIATQNKELDAEDLKIIDLQLQNIKNDFEQLVNDKISGNLTSEQKEQFKNFKWIYVDRHNPNLLTPEKWPSVDHVIKETKFDAAHDRDSWNKFFELLKEVITELDAKYSVNRWYMVAKQKRVSFTDLNARTLNSKESALGKLLHDIFKQYFDTKYSFEHKLAKRGMAGEEIDFDFERESFNGEYKAPWLFLNEILTEYRCNGYFFDEADLLPPKAPQPYNVNVSLRNKNGALVHVDNLSSGEQTLFALAASLFSEKTSGSLPELLLLDEIDASLHPSMCEQLLDVLRNVFVEQQQVKIIMVTHSPSTIAHANEDETYVMSVSEDGKKHCVTKEGKENALKALTSGFMTLDEGINIFNNVSEDVILISEGENKKFLDLAVDHFLNEVEKNKVSVVLHKNLGDSQLRTVYDLYRRINQSKKIFYIWDCDYSDKFPTDGNDYNFPFLLRKHTNNQNLDRGIEASFDENLFPTFEFEEKKDNAREVIGKGVKNKKQFFVKLRNENNVAQNFINFKPLFDKIKEVANFE